MGCDGGTIPTRGELVRTKKKKEKISKEDNLNVKWRHCALSQEQLALPIVACELGKLFNKESILNYLLDKSGPNCTVQFSYIRNLKDVKELRLTLNPEYCEDLDRDKSGSKQRVAQFICPISGLEMNGKFRFILLWNCGCVFSDRGFKQIKDGVCITCGKAYKSSDVIQLNPDDEEIEQLTIKMQERRANNQKIKKTKLSCTVTNLTENPIDKHEPVIKKQKIISDMNSNSFSSEGSNSKSNEFLDESSKLNGKAYNNKINNVSLNANIKSSILIKNSNNEVEEEESSACKIITDSSSSDSNKSKGSKEISLNSDNKEKRNSSLAIKETKLDVNQGKNGLNSNSIGSINNKIKMPSHSSIQKDCNASETYKSLFNTHETAKKQIKAHWVTHNPLYY